jgi:hypothetical protein
MGDKEEIVTIIGGERSSLNLLSLASDVTFDQLITYWASGINFHSRLTDIGK